MGFGVFDFEEEMERGGGGGQGTGMDGQCTDNRRFVESRIWGNWLLN